MAFCEILSADLSIKINTTGAELVELRRCGDDHNWIWSAESPWKRSAPHLFPIVGKLSEDSYRFSDRTYHLTQHGFSRDMNFEVVSSDLTSVHFQLKWCEATKERYPFDFILDVFYRISDSRLIVAYQVQNVGQERMLFNIGWHPAFVLPAQKKLPLEIKTDRNLGVFQYLRDGLIRSSNADGNFECNKMYIEAETFANDALVFLSNKSNTVEISDAAGNSIAINTGNCPFLGMWSKDPRKFICIEPWWGVPDLVAFIDDFESKYGIQTLEPSLTWMAEMSVEVRVADENS